MTQEFSNMDESARETSRKITKLLDKRDRKTRRKTIEECAAILDENARYFTGIDASVVGALHAGAAEIRALAEDKEG